MEKLDKLSKLGVRASHNISERNTENHMSITTSEFLRVKIEPFSKRIMKIDKKWITYYSIVRKAHWLDKDQTFLSDDT